MHEKRHNPGDDGREGEPAGSRERRYDLAKLVAELSPENVHPEVDWGEPRGEEVW